MRTWRNWVTYLGGSHSENGTSNSGGLALGPGGSIIVAGTTSSSDFPTTTDAIQAVKNGVGEDLFIAILSPDGSQLLYGSYLGGSAADLLTAFERDSEGSLYLAGITLSADFPVSANAFQAGLPGAQSGFLLRLTSDAKAIEYGTYFGGTANDTISALAVRSSSEVWVGGDTSSSDLPLTPDAFDRTRGGCGTTACDAFLAGLNTDTGQLTYSTFVGGASGDVIHDLELFGANVLYVVGDTNSPDFPLTNWTVKPQQGNPGVHDGFVMKFITDCRAIGYSTLFGGDKGGEQALGVTTSLGEPVVVGYTGSTDFPVASDAVQTSFGGFIDSFMVKIGSEDVRFLTPPIWVVTHSMKQSSFPLCARDSRQSIVFSSRRVKQCQNRYMTTTPGLGVLQMFSSSDGGTRVRLTLIDRETVKIQALPQFCY
jgi:hypothetical protein